MVKTSSYNTRMQTNILNEDEKKMAGYASNQGTGNWTSFPKKSGLRRSGKCSRQKWSNNEKVDPNHKTFTSQEEELVIQLHAAIGSRWPIIAQQFPGKTDNDVKILWNSKLRKKLSAMGIDPITHKPFSQILADYGSIGAFPKPPTRFTSLSRDLKGTTFNHSIDLYSQLQTINLATTDEHENKTQHHMTDFSASSSNDEITSFSWSDFLLEDAFLPSNNVIDQQNYNGKQRTGGGVENKNSEIDKYETSSSSNTSFVEAMIESQDEMFSHFPGLYEEPLYY